MNAPLFLWSDFGGAKTGVVRLLEEWSFGEIGI